MRLDLDGLAAASRKALTSEWREVVGRPPPKHLSRPLMVQILSHTYQLDAVGGYTKRLDGRLKSAARRDVVRPAFKPGSRFVWKDLQVEMQNNHFFLGSVFEKSRMTSLSNKLMANKKGARMRPSDLINFCFNHSLLCVRPSRVGIHFVWQETLP